jgi:methyl-accepting chemotaxis protein
MNNVGKGFQVVAQEIKKMATNITDFINRIR